MSRVNPHYGPSAHPGGSEPRGFGPHRLDPASDAPAGAIRGRDGGARDDSDSDDSDSDDSDSDDSDRDNTDRGDADRGNAGQHLGQASQCRRDVLTGRWVIFAPGRSERPAEIFEVESPAPSSTTCPFCAGNESHTPPATFSIHDTRQGTVPWRVRVVPNLFPAVSAGAAGEGVRRAGVAPPMSGEDLVDETFNLRVCDPIGESERPAEDAESLSTRDQPGGGQDSLFEVTDLHGGHEVIVETPEHVESLTALPEEHAGRVFEAYAERMRHWFEVPGVQYVVAFKNVGAAAGASLRHTHSQLIATSLLPPTMTEVGRRVERYYRQSRRCLLCSMIDGEMADERRVVLKSDNFVAFCPFASRLPYLVRIAPRDHFDRFETMPTPLLHELSRMTQRVLRSLEQMFVSCAYNYTIHTRPRYVSCPSSYHWWMEIFPRLTKVAGFEWGSDCFINPITPEVAAGHLRGERRGCTRHPESIDFSD